jgi:hypothetical protein
MKLSYLLSVLAFAAMNCYGDQALIRSCLTARDIFPGDTGRNVKLCAEELEEARKSHTDKDTELKLLRQYARFVTESGELERAEKIYLEAIEVAGALDLRGYETRETIFQALQVLYRAEKYADAWPLLMRLKDMSNLVPQDESNRHQALFRSYVLEFMNESLGSKATALVEDQAELATLRSRVAKPITSQVAVISAKFGVINSFSSRKPFLEESNKISISQEQSGLAWSIQLRTKKTDINWKEELQFPIKPEDVHAIPQFGISVNGNTVTTERTSPLESGKRFSNSWWFNETHPRGKYVMRVYIEGVLLKQVEYDVD